MIMTRGLGLLLFAVVALATACGPPDGTERGHCRADGSCDEGLVCASKFCVVPPAGEEGEGEGEEGEGESSGPPGIAELESALSAAFDRCRVEPFAQLVAALDATEEALQRDIAVNAALAPLRNGLADGSAVVDDDALARCIDELAVPFCITGGRPPAFLFGACADIARGTRGVGDDCETDLQCVSRNCNETACLCVGDTPPTARSLGVIECDSPGDCPGGACGFETRDDGSFTAVCLTVCALDSECPAGQSCAGFLCNDLIAQGDACGPFINAECEPGRVCDGSECVDAPDVGEPCVALHCGDDALGCAGDGTCQPRVGEGEDCLVAPCAHGLVCDGAARVCRPPADVGEICFDDVECESACDEHRLICVRDEPQPIGADCASAVCEDSLVCATRPGGSTCESVVFGGPGETCTPGTNLLVCEYGFRCEGATSTCAPIAVVDEGACSNLFELGPLCRDMFSTRQCKMDALTPTFAGTCADRPAVDAPCDSLDLCEEDVAACRRTTNDAGTCERLPAVGESCLGVFCPRDLLCDGAGVCSTYDDATYGFHDNICIAAP